MKKISFKRLIFPIILVVLILAYPLFWHIEIATTPVDPDQFIDPTGIVIALAIIIGVFYYGALWLATLIYAIILRARKIISKKRFFITLSALIAVLLGAILFFILA